MKKTTYVNIELKYSYDEDGYRVFQIPEAGQIKEQLCEGWDVDVDENGPFKVICECNQCKQINRQEAWECKKLWDEEPNIYTREDLR